MVWYTIGISLGYSWIYCGLVGSLFPFLYQATIYKKSYNEIIMLPYTKNYPFVRVFTISIFFVGFRVDMVQLVSS